MSVFSQLLKYQFVVIHTVKGFGIVNTAEVDVFLELSCFFHDPADVGNIMSGSNCSFLICIKISQEASKVVCYSHLFKNFPVCCNPHKGFDVVNKAEVDVFLELSCYFWWFLLFLAIWTLVSLPVLSPSWTSRISWFTSCWSVAWRILSITLLACEMSAIVQ